VVSIITEGLRNATQRTAPEFRQHAAGTCGFVTIPLPQALALPTFFATFLANGKKFAV